ncbi:MAG: hypothetical protein JRG73_15790 [Deltaproteobacteria bacterium]|nr:hypothetical protein [Deltaproteobacteria bacterium]MBW2308387.1 hypothetical protein [Deltaproteobacteria bacterium]
MNQVSERENTPPTGQVNPVIPLKKLEREALIQALSMTDYNISRAARMLGISRAAFYRKIQYHRIKIENKYPA